MNKVTQTELVRTVLKSNINLPANEVVDRIKKVYSVKVSKQMVWNVRYQVKKEQKEMSGTTNGGNKSANTRIANNNKPLWRFILEALLENGPCDLKTLINRVLKIGYKSTAGYLNPSMKRVIKNLQERGQVETKNNKIYLVDSNVPTPAIVDPMPTPAVATSIDIDLEHLHKVRTFIIEMGGIEKLEQYVDELRRLQFA